MRESDERFHQMGDNIVEIFGIVHADTKHVIFT